MKKVLGLAAAAALFSTAALADPLAGVYGKIITISDAEGNPVSQTVINADGTYSTTPAGGEAVSGAWEIKDDAACFAGTDAEGNATELCSAEILGKNSGDSYEVTADDGTTTSVSIE